MALLLHIIIALASLVFTSYVFVAPSKVRMQFAYTLVVLTLVTGSYLVFTKPAHMAETCVTGLAYIVVVSLGLVAAQKKLAHQHSS